MFMFEMDKCSDYKDFGLFKVWFRQVKLYIKMDVI